MTSLRPPARALSALRSRKPSTNGPFQIERATGQPLLAFARMTAARDEFVGPLVLAGLGALGRLAPRRDRMTAARGAAFAAAERMIDRVHGDAAHRRHAALPAIAAGLADIDVAVVRVRHRTDGRHAVLVDET